VALRRPLTDSRLKEFGITVKPKDEGQSKGTDNGQSVKVENPPVEDE
jgi:hypothetical protein